MTSVSIVVLLFCFFAHSIDVGFFAEAATRLMDHREIQLLNNVLQVKSMMHMHSRVITFINNIFVCGKFQVISSHFLM